MNEFVTVHNLMKTKDDNMFMSTQTEIKEHVYGKVTTPQVIKQQKHLDNKHKEKLKKVLNDHKVLFDGKLGRYTDGKVHIELEPNASQVWQRPFPIPFQHKSVFFAELDQMICNGILRRRHAVSNWMSPKFLISKKNGTIRVITDFCELNKVIKWHAYPMPV